MIAAPVPANEKERMKALHRYRILDTPEEKSYDELVKLAAEICEAPYSVITLIDGDRQWFKAKNGMEGKENSRRASFCGHTILLNELLEVPNALEDERFHNNPDVLGGLGIRFYAGAPLHTHDGYNLGSLCVFDSQVRALSNEQKSALKVLAKQVVKQMELDLKERQLKTRTNELNGIFEISRIKDKLELSMGEMLQEIVDIIPGAFQFPEHTCSSISLFRYTKQTTYFKKTASKLVCPIRDDANNTIGSIEVYVDEETGKNSELFLPEEGSLLEEIARQIKNGAARKAYEEKFFSINQNLEQDVKDRTKELLESNKKLQEAYEELESFSYSISHDLQAPLRVITGFSKILKKDFAGDIGVEGSKVLDHIIINTGKMAKQISGLLTFSRFVRQKKAEQRFSMNCLVKDVIDELKILNQERDIVFRIEDLPDALGDQFLIRHVVTNILSNALKFTGTKKQAVITVSGFIKNGEVVYRFQDNGVGFNMKYVKSIFEVFQRLHGESEFPGTGIGMALAKKIINRHGGNIWAEGVLNNGASFYFSLKHP